MSHPPRRPSAPTRSGSGSKRRTFSLGVPASQRDSPSGPFLAAAGPNGKAQRTSKTSQKLVLLPTAPQTKPLRTGKDKHIDKYGGEEEEEGDERDEDSDELGYETDAGVRVRDHKSAGERMSKAQRRKAGFRRLTAYCVAENLKMKLLAGFLKREHNVAPRIYDEALYVMYHLPLLPGYGPNSNIRSSAVNDAPSSRTILRRMSEAEEIGYQGTYFTSESEPLLDPQGYIPSSSPLQTRPDALNITTASEGETDAEGVASSPETVRSPMQDYTKPDYGSELPPSSSSLAAQAEADTKPRDFASTSTSQHSEKEAPQDENIAEVIFFDYGVVVFFGLSEPEERAVLDDISRAGILRRPIDADSWEVEECHYAHDPSIAYPRIYNDFFTLRSHSHFLKLSIAHALAQSTLLARYETGAARVLAAPETVAIPRQLAQSGKLALRRRDALRLTGRLFKLRRDVNLVSPVLDVPELFWSEATLGDLYSAVRDYMEITGRVEALNEKLGVANDLLDAIHDHLNNSAMERITWIIIWLIVAAVLVELGEVMARLIVHATTRKSNALAMATFNASMQLRSMSKEEALLALERIMGQS